VAKAVNSSLYYILSSLREDRQFSLSPGGLASNAYNGHVFWDAETWMYPPLLVWHPRLARSMLDYRIGHLEAARQNAVGYFSKYGGAKFPWESAVSGSEVTAGYIPYGESEVHIGGDISFAARQYVFMCPNQIQWLQSGGYLLVAEIAEFWIHRATLGSDGLYHINRVLLPDEYALGDDSVYTNAVAKLALDFAIHAAKLLDLQGNPKWQQVADSLVVLVDSTRQLHPEFLGYKWGTTIKQADVVLLAYPLGIPMSRQVQFNDLKHYSSVTDPNGPAMTWGMHAIGYLNVGDAGRAASNFNRSFANVKPPFGVWTETPTGGVTNFITGAGGFLQAIMFGYLGMRIHPTHVSFTPRLLQGAASMVFRGIHYRGSLVSIRYDTLHTNLTLHFGSPLRIQTNNQDHLLQTFLCLPALHDFNLTLAGQNVVPAQSLLMRFAVVPKPMTASAQLMVPLVLTIGLLTCITIMRVVLRCKANAVTFSWHEQTPIAYMQARHLSTPCIE